MIPTFTPYDWYWAVEGKYWSSKLSAFVDTLPEGAGMTTIADAQELTDVLRRYGLRGPMPSVDDVIMERNRRMEAGFDYDFGDARGIHHFGTKDSDMRGWAEVTDWMNANLGLNNLTEQLIVLTNTGSATVTPIDWAKVLQAAGNFRQPLWSASFLLQAENPIPADYYADKWWPK